MESTAEPGFRILSVAPAFGVGPVPFAGHEEIYQLGLSRAAEAAGVPWTVLAPVGSSVSDRSVVPVLERGGPDRIADSVARHLRAQPAETDGAEKRAFAVVVYEADVALAVAMARVAGEHPEVRFLVNLFRAEPGLDAPLERRKRYGTSPELAAYTPEALTRRFAALAGLVLPRNLSLTAETDAKALLARSVGLPVIGTWQLHSQLAAAPIPSAGQERSSSRGVGVPVRVLVALRSSQLRAPLVQDVVDIIDGVASVSGRRSIAWTMAGRFDTDRRVIGALRRLERAGVEIDRDDRPLTPDAYAAVFAGVDAVWMPSGAPYRVQSSGKALDALVLGRPIVAPAGTAGALAMQRWVPGTPAYGSTTEAIQLFLRLPSMVDLLHADLARRQAEIRTASSPSATVAWVIATLVGERDSDVTAMRFSPPGDVGTVPLRNRGAGETPSITARAVRRVGRAVGGAMRVAGAVPRGLRAFVRELAARR